MVDEGESIMATAAHKGKMGEKAELVQAWQRLGGGLSTLDWEMPGYFGGWSWGREGLGRERMLVEYNAIQPTCQSSRFL